MTDDLSYNTYGTFAVPELLISRCIKHKNILGASRVTRKDNALKIHYSVGAIGLQTLLDNDDTSLKQKIKIIYEIGTVLALLHSKGLCHTNISVDCVTGHYESIYFVPRVMVKAVRGTKELMTADVEDYKSLIFRILCPDVEETYKVTKNDLSLILPFVPEETKDFVTRIVSHNTLYQMLSSPIFDNVKDLIGEGYDKIIDYENVPCPKVIVCNVSSSELIDPRYREGIKEINFLFKHNFKNRYADELMLSIDLYNRAFPLVLKGMNLRCFYVTCILLASKIYDNNMVPIDDIRSAVHDCFKEHPKRCDVLSAELDIIVYLKGLLYNPNDLIYENCTSVMELYSVLNYYILDRDRYMLYPEFIVKLKKLHEGQAIGLMDYVTCEELHVLDNSINNLSDEEADKLESLLD